MFDAAATAFDFFSRDFWKGSRPGPKTTLDIFPMGDGRVFHVKVHRVLAWRRERERKTDL